MSVEGLGVRLTALESLSPGATPKHHGPDGHHEDDDNQDTVLGNGAYKLALPASEFGPSTEQFGHQNGFSGFRNDRQHRDTNHCQFRMPKTIFPKFDGTHPKIWKEKAEIFFHIVHVLVEYMVDYATLHFTGQAALWLQTYEAQHTIDSWVQLCVAVCQKFGTDLYYSQMSKILDSKQVSDVDTYQFFFEQLMHQLLTHNPSLDETFFVIKFVKGLEKDIRSAIVLHKPRTVNAAISLALLQEQQLWETRRTSYQPKRWHNKAGPGQLGPHPAGVQTDTHKAPVQDQSVNKLVSLRAQRIAIGECFKCSQMW